MPGRSPHPFTIIPWNDDFLERLHTLIGEITDGAPGKAVVVFPLNRPRRYLLDIYRQKRSGPTLLPTIINAQQLTQLCLESWDPDVRRRAGTLDQVALLQESVRAVSRKEDAATALGKLASQLDAEDGDGMARFFPWGVRLAQVLEECSSNLVEAFDLQHLEGETAPFAAALLSGLRRIQEDYHARMKSRHLSTAGLDAQRAAELASSAPELPRKLQGRKIIIAGFVRLTAAEDKLFRHLWENGAHLCLHTDPLVASGGGHWSCADHREWLSRWKAQANVVGETAAIPPRIHFLAGYDLHSQLAELRRDLEASPQTDERRAVVLSHDSLLMPTLHHIPEKDINISLGYPLNRSLLARLVERILKTQERMDGEGRVYWRDLLALIRHPYVRMLAVPSEAGSRPLRPFLSLMETRLREGTRLVDTASCVQDLVDETLGELEKHPPEGCDEETGTLLEQTGRVLVTNWHSVKTLHGLADCLRELCGLLRSFGGHLWESFPLDAECLSRLIQNVIPELCDNALSDIPLSQATLFAILRQSIDAQRVPFEADPLTGLQILGTLETRLLRFDRVHVLDLTEDALPGAPSHDPLLPDNLRRELGLPDTRHRDMLAAHTFHRLIAGAKDVFLYWQEGITDSLFDTKKNRSRFVEELLWQEEHRQKKILGSQDPPLKAATFKISAPPKREAQVIERTPQINARMNAFLSGKLFPSALDEYLSCPAQFFYHRVCGLNALQEVVEDDDHLGVGNLLHKVLCRAYGPFVGRTVRQGEISPETLDALFRDELKKSGLADTLPAQSRFMLEVAARHRLPKFLENQPEEFELLQVEKESTALLAVDGKNFSLAGKLDRLDKRGEDLIVLDYKTGRRLPRPARRFWEDDELWERMESWSPESEDSQEDTLLPKLASRLRSIQLPCYLYLCTNGSTSKNLMDGCASANAGWVHLAGEGKELFLFDENMDETGQNSLIQEKIPKLLSFLLRHMAESRSFVPQPDKSAYGSCGRCAYAACCLR